ncbi:MAG: sulfotransferase domain-containing protein [Pseudomonadota bacterium]
MGRAHDGPKVNYRPYEPQPGDVFIAPWAKSGTTLMQQMFHQLRSGGDMDFDDISRVVPWEDTAVMLDFDMTEPQVASPRGFKSHREYERLPPGMRYVAVVRDPKETFVSLYRFFNGWQLERDAVPMEDFMPLWLGGGPNGCDYFTYLNSWYARRDDADTLLMTYRWVVKNRETVLRRLAALCEIELTDDRIALVMERTSREFMVEHKDRFDDGMVCAVLEEKCGISAASDSSKVQSTGSSADVLPSVIADAIDAMWAERVLPRTGHPDFASLAAEVDALFDD